MSIEDFFRKPAYGGAELSPSGRYLAVITPVRERLGLRVFDLEEKTVVTMETPYGAGDVLAVTWQNNTRMLVSIGDRQRVAGERPSESGLIAVNRDGTDARTIARVPLWYHVFPGSTEILITARERSLKFVDIYRYDTESGVSHLLSMQTPGFAANWVVDFDNVPRAVISNDIDADRSAWYVRRSERDPWVKVDEARLGELQSTPMQFDGTGKILYVRARRNGEDLASIYEYNVDAGTWKKVVSDTARDVRATFINDSAEHKVLGLRYVGDRTSTAWFDPEYARVQKGVDAALPGTVNLLQRRGGRWLVTCYSDRIPGDVYLLDGKTMQMEKLFSYRPQIDPKTMSPMKWVRYPARDGLAIPALLTIPDSAHGKPVPLVVDIHGGPNVEASEWGYNFEVQFFASRGYAVLQPQYRGTEGFGWKFESAGFRHWGDTMQNDLADGVKWAVAKGIADPSRVCFYGASYGGYASAWGSIANADLIKCAVVFAGITSVDYLFDSTQTVMSRVAEKDSVMRDRIGDPKTERARFRSISPLDQAARVGVPLLLAYGASDHVVPIEHGNDFRSALDKYHKPYEWVAYDDEGHGLGKDEDVFDFYGRVERFLGKYLGGIVTSGKPEGATVH